VVDFHGKAGRLRPAQLREFLVDDVDEFALGTIGRERTEQGRALDSLFRESVVFMKEGEDVDEAFRIISQRTESLQFQRFVATLSYATASGANIEGALKAYMEELTFTQANEISLYANEAIRLSTFMVIVTGVIPGLLVFMISQGSVISSIRVPVIYLLPIYLIAFPLIKYLLTVRLVKSSPGV